ARAAACCSAPMCWRWRRNYATALPSSRPGALWKRAPRRILWASRTWRPCFWSWQGKVKAMRELWCLVKVDFRAMLVALSFGRGKTGKAGGIGALILLAALPLYLSGMYSFLLAEWMRANGALGFLMPVMTLLGIFMSLMLTMFGASGIVYGGRDMDLML